MRLFSHTVSSKLDNKIYCACFSSIRTYFYRLFSSSGVFTTKLFSILKGFKLFHLVPVTIFCVRIRKMLYWLSRICIKRIPRLRIFYVVKYHFAGYLSIVKLHETQKPTKLQVWCQSRSVLWHLTLYKQLNSYCIINGRKNGQA